MFLKNIFTHAIRFVFTCLLATGSLITVPLQAQPCEDVCIDDVRSKQSVDFLVENTLTIPAWVSVSIQSENMQADSRLPFTAIFPPDAKVPAFNLSASNPYRSWRYEYKFEWRGAEGYGGKHDDTYQYDLPYAAGTAHRVVQTFNGKFSHQGKHAIDWGMPEGTPIHAAREGLVIYIETSHNRGGPEERFREFVNYVLIRHDDGTIGGYYHLRQHGSAVQVGDIITRGQLIGYSGSTGYASGPHLHFEVYFRDKKVEKRTVPITFWAGQESGIFLKEGLRYQAGN